MDRLRPPFTDHAHHPLRMLTCALASEAGRLGSATVLDLGCGAKPYAPLFTGRFLGLDVLATHGRPDVRGVAEALPLADGSVDAVLSTQQLEHVDEPGSVLDEAARVLRSGGTLLLSTHGVWPYHPDPDDYWRWTERGLTRLIAEHGFAVERVHQLGSSVMAGVLLALYPVGGARRSRNPLLRFPAALILGAVNALLAVGDPILARVLPRSYASTGYLVVARKP